MLNSEVALTAFHQILKISMSTISLQNVYYINIKAQIALSVLLQAKCFCLTRHIMLQV